MADESERREFLKAFHVDLESAHRRRSQLYPKTTRANRVELVGIMHDLSHPHELVLAM